MNEALKNILERNSHRNLVEPIPSKDEMEKVFQAALRAPDHAWLRPSSFIQISGDGLQRLSDIFVDFAEENFDDLTEERIEKYRNAPFRAPLIVVLVSTKKDHPKVYLTKIQILNIQESGGQLSFFGPADFART